MKSSASSTYVRHSETARAPSPRGRAVTPAVQAPVLRHPAGVVARAQTVVLRDLAGVVARASNIWSRCSRLRQE